SSSATIAACRFVYAGKSATSATSFWAQGYGGMAIKLAGVHVAINFGGDVQVVGCAFAGAEELAVEEEMAAPTHTKRKEIKEKNSIVKESGAYSKPVLKLDNKFDCILRKMPSLSQLAASLPRFVAQRASVAGVVLAGAQCRNSRTFQQESWSPTANQFYAIGNTHGFDVTAGLLLSGAADKAAALRLQRRQPLRRLEQQAAEIRNRLAPRPHSAPNITLLISPSLQYCNYITSSIVRALPLGGPPSASLATRLLATLAPQLTKLTAQLRAGSTSVSLGNLSSRYVSSTAI
ncbi:hypothetical protein T492DRAFT_851486, partial [Pavlovales sp. CCMP2436]